MIVLLLLWVFATTSVGLWAWLRSAARPTAAPSTPGSVLLLRPLAGDEPSLESALETSVASPLVTSIRFLVATAEDSALLPAAEVAQRLSSQGHDARVVITRATAANAKAGQLAGAIAAEDSASIVVVADSDVLLSRELVDALVGAAARGDAAWAPPREVTPATLADRASAAVLDASVHSFILLAGLDRGTMVGKAFAIRRDALQAIGGFGDLGMCLGEDMEMSRRLRVLGRRIEVVDAVARSGARGRGWSAVLRRYARWISVVRAQRPALLVSYPLLFCAAPIQLVLALSLVHGRPGIELALGIVAARTFVGYLARHRAGGRLALVAPWVADLVLLAAFVLAIVRRRIEWRGRRLEIGRAGKLVEVES